MEATAPLTSWCDPLVIISGASAVLYAIFIIVVLKQTSQSKENVNKQINSNNKFQWLTNFIQLNSRLIRSFNDYENCKLTCTPYFEKDEQGNKTQTPIRDFQDKSLQDRYSELHNDLVEFDLMIKSYGIEKARKVKGIYLETFINLITSRIKNEANYVTYRYENPEEATRSQEKADKELMKLGDFSGYSTGCFLTLLNKEIENISKEVSKKVYV